MAGSGRVITYRELNEESNRLAHLLRAQGLGPGDHIAFMLENELAYIVGNCEAKVFITSRVLTGTAEAIAERTPGVRLRLMLDGTAPGFLSYEEEVAGRPVTPIDDECEGATCPTIAYCRERLALFKCPRTVDFRDEPPRHPTGKLYKRLLRDEYWKGHTGPGSPSDRAPAAS